MPEQRGEKGLIAGFFISDRASCETATRNGGITAIFSAVLTSVVIVIRNRDLNSLMQPWLLAEITLIFVLGIFIFKKSRVASTLMVVYFAASKIVMWSQGGSLLGLPIAVIFFLVFFTAMRGAFLWHSTYKKAPQRNEPDSSLLPTDDSRG